MWTMLLFEVNHILNNRAFVLDQQNKTIPIPFGEIVVDVHGMQHRKPYNTLSLAHGLPPDVKLTNIVI